MVNTNHVTARSEILVHRFGRELFVRRRIGFAIGPEGKAEGLTSRPTIRPAISSFLSLICTLGIARVVLT